MNDREAQKCYVYVYRVGGPVLATSEGPNCFKFTTVSPGQFQIKAGEKIAIKPVQIFQGSINFYLHLMGFGPLH